MRNHRKGFVTVCFVLSFLFLSSCQFRSNPSKKEPIQSVRVSFCTDILGASEPVFSEPFLMTLKEIEQKGLITLSFYTSHFKTEYPKAISSAASENDIVFCTPFMAAIAGFLCKRFSVSKKIGAIFGGDPNANLSIVEADAFSKEARFLDGKDSVNINFLDVATPLSKIKEIYRKLLLSNTDMIYIASGSFLPDILSESNIKPAFPYRLICPWIRQSSNGNIPILGMIQKQYKPILEKIILDKRQSKFKEGHHFVGIKEDGFEFISSDKSFTQKDKDDLRLFLKSY